MVHFEMALEKTPNNSHFFVFLGTIWYVNRGKQSEFIDGDAL